MSSDFTLRDRFWRDVATVATGPRDFDPRAIREAVENTMRNYHLDEVPVFESASQAEAPNVPDSNNLANHSMFAPVFSTVRNAVSSYINTARPAFVGPPCCRTPRRQRSRQEPRHPDHFPGGGSPGIQANTVDVGVPSGQPHAPAHPAPPVNAAAPRYPSFQLPSWVPNHYIWAFQTGHLAWSPHPQPHPSGRQQPSNSEVEGGMGGHPLPNTTPDVPIHLSPHIIANPNNANLPLIDWDVTKHPSTAKRLTPNHVVVDMADIWDHAVTHPEAQRIMVACDVAHVSTLWGPIEVGHTNEPASVRDLFYAIYHHFQIRLTSPELRYITELNPGIYPRLSDAFHKRCRESMALPGWEERQGFRRADLLGDQRYWSGVGVSLGHGDWWLNLGLMDQSHRGRS